MKNKLEPIIISRETPGELDYVEFNKSYELDNYYSKACKIKGSPLLTIVVLSHRNVNSLKMCVECILRFANGIDFELVLLDNSSNDNDETYNFMLSVPYDRKKIIKVQDNMGGIFNTMRGWQTLFSHEYCKGDYIQHFNDDVFLTENALQNMLRALDENPDIGMVGAKSSNAGFGQNPGLIYKNEEEMFEAAKLFNVYDPQKWEEKILIAPLASVYRREVLNCIYTSSPFAFEAYTGQSIRAAGYRTFLMGDTWVHHDHDYTQKATHGFTEQSSEGEKMRLNIDELTKHTYYGLKLTLGDASSYVSELGFETSLVSLIKDAKKGESLPNILSIDVKAGQGLLDVKNKLRLQGYFDCTTTAYSTNQLYYPWLYSIADEVIIDRIDYIYERLNDKSFDYIITGRPINLFKADPLKLLDLLISKLNPGGQLLFKLRNTASSIHVLKMMDIVKSSDDEMPIVISAHEIVNHLVGSGYPDYVFGMIPYSNNDTLEKIADQIISAAPEIKDRSVLKEFMQTRDFMFMVQKPKLKVDTDNKLNTTVHQTEQELSINNQKPLNETKKSQPSKVNLAGYYDFCRYDILAMITHNESSPINILEIGCSGGGTLAKIKDVWKNSSVKGIEIVPEIAEVGKNKGLDVICCNIEEAELPYEKESFDYIILADVIEHLREPEEVLKIILLYLKKGGSFLCSVPNIQHITIINNLIKGKFEYTDSGILDKTHLRFFTLHSIRQLFDSIGTKIEILQGITWSTNGPVLTDIMNEPIDSEKLYTFQQILLSAKK